MIILESLRVLSMDSLSDVIRQGGVSQVKELEGGVAMQQRHAQIFWYHKWKESRDLLQMASSAAQRLLQSLLSTTTIPHIYIVKHGQVIRCCPHSRKLSSKYALHLATLHVQQVTILFPPAAAAIITGCSCDLLINILLTMYAYLTTTSTVC